MGAVAAVSVVCKTPRAGASKTRLQPLLGPDAAATLSACFISDVAAAVATLPAALGWKGYAIYAPAGSESALRPLLPTDWGLVCREDADFGAVLFSSVAGFLADGHDCALVINSDSPTLPPRLISMAIEALRAPGDRLVLGPATDGGYYLVGLKRPHSRLFEAVRWSTPDVLPTSLERAAEISLPVRLLPAWYDIDDAETFGFLEAEIAGRPLPFAEPGLVGGPALHTRAFLARHAAAVRTGTGGG